MTTAAAIDPDELRSWCLHVNGITSKNTDSVMRVATKLVTGMGVTHKNKPGEVFRGNTIIDMTTDMQNLLNDAVAWLPPSGPNILDHGHGWALRHPVKKLQLFKEYKNQGVNPIVSPYFENPPPAPTRKRQLSSTPRRLQSTTTSKDDDIFTEYRFQGALENAPAPKPKPLPMPNLDSTIVPATKNTMLDVSDEENEDVIEPVKYLTAGDQFATYLGNNVDLMRYANDRYSKPGGMPAAAVRNYFKHNPEQLPECHKGKTFGNKSGNIQVCHIISCKLGGVDWPLNYGIYDIKANQFFGEYYPLQWVHYIGHAAHQAATDFARWFKLAAETQILFSRYNPRTDFLMVRGHR
jgi:hypothetical protein